MTFLTWYILPGSPLSFRFFVRARGDPGNEASMNAGKLIHFEQWALGPVKTLCNLGGNAKITLCALEKGAHKVLRCTYAP